MQIGVACFPLQRLVRLCVEKHAATAHSRAAASSALFATVHLCTNDDAVWELPPVVAPMRRTGNQQMRRRRGICFCFSTLVLVPAKQEDIIFNKVAVVCRLPNGCRRTTDTQIARSQLRAMFANNRKKEISLTTTRTMSRCDRQREMTKMYPLEARLAFLSVCNGVHLCNEFTETKK